MKMSEREEEAWVCSKFDALAAARSKDERDTYLAENPLMFSGGAQGLIQTVKGNDPKVYAIVLYLDRARAHFTEHPENYPLGAGPLETIAANLAEGELDRDDALARARASDCANNLSHTYMNALLRSWISHADTDAGYALDLADVALEAAQAMALPRLALDVRRATAEGFIRLVHRALLRRPDGRAYARAFEIGAWAIEDARAAKRPALEGGYLHNLGALAQDSYGHAFGPGPSYLEQTEARLARAIHPMPPPAEGFARAREMLTAAVPLREAGSDRGLTLKALLETEVYLAFATKREVDREAVASLAEKALAELDAKSDGEAIERVRWLAERFGKT